MVCLCSKESLSGTRQGLQNQTCKPSTSDWLVSPRPCQAGARHAHDYLAAQPPRSKPPAALVRTLPPVPAPRTAQPQARRSASVSPVLTTAAPAPTSSTSTHQLHQPSSAANAPVQLAVLTPDSQGTQRGAHCSADGGHRPAEAGIHGGRPWAGSPGRPGRKCSHPCGVSVVGVPPSKPALWTLPLQAAGRHEPERKARGVPACLRACASSQAGRDRPVNTDGSRAPLRGILDLLSDSRRGIRAFRLPGGSATPLDNAAVQEIPRSHVTQL